MRIFTIKNKMETLAYLLVPGLKDLDELIYLKYSNDSDINESRKPVNVHRRLFGVRIHFLVTNKDDVNNTIFFSKINRHWKHLRLKLSLQLQI